jgi:hypothetical protein
MSAILVMKTDIQLNMTSLEYFVNQGEIATVIDDVMIRELAYSTSFMSGISTKSSLASFSVAGTRRGGHGAEFDLLWCKALAVVQLAEGGGRLSSLDCGGAAKEGTDLDGSWLLLKNSWTVRWFAGMDGRGMVASWERIPWNKYRNYSTIMRLM